MSLQLQVDRLLSGREPRSLDLKLHLGCGANILPGWINTDATPAPTADYLDFARRFPFPENLFAVVFCEHSIEHAGKPQALGLIAEVFRVLRPGGLFRVVTPSLDSFARLAIDPQSPTAQKYLAWFRLFSKNPTATTSDAVNTIFYGHGHQHIYMVDELTELLERAGFTNVKSMPAGRYDNPVFQNVDAHGRVIGDDINSIEAFALEAAKSG
jgi:SAM-dependent methyltransferase